MSTKETALTQGEARQLVELVGSLQQEAASSAEAGAWRAAVVLLGSAIEAGILATACADERALRRAGRLPGRKTLTRYTLGELVKVASAAGWLPRALDDPQDVFAPLAGDVGDALQFLLRVRNAAIHPGNFISTLADVGADFGDIEHMKPTYEIFNGIMDAVFAKLTEVVRGW
jgi:hypothetical protein